MQYQRLHIRVPASGSVILSVGKIVRVEASVINISAGGLCITAPSDQLERDEYHIEVTTASHGKIKFSGLPVYQTEESVGIKINSIDRENLKTVYEVVESFQLTEEFIKHIDEQDMLKEWLVDDAGNDIAITFETHPIKDDKQDDP